jgi:hypothetical protein
VLDLAGHLTDQGRVGADAAGDRRVAGEQPEPVGVLLDVSEEGERGPLEQLARAAGIGEGGGEAVEQLLHLPGDDVGVEAVLAAEVLVHDRLAHLGVGGDLLDGGRLVALLAEQLAADVEQLPAPLRPGHPDPVPGPAAGHDARRPGAHGRRQGVRGTFSSTPWRAGAWRPAGPGRAT